MAKRALVVDDVRFARQVISRILTENNYQVIGEASDGIEAIEQYAKLEPDFVTMDIVMPRKNGIEACRTIVEKYPTARIIIVSAMSHEQLLMDAINAGASDYIIKPFSAEDLLKSVEKLFEGQSDDDDFVVGGPNAS